MAPCAELAAMDSTVAATLLQVRFAHPRCTEHAPDSLSWEDEAHWRGQLPYDGDMHEEV